MDWKEHVVLDKDNGKVRAEVKTSDTKNSYEHSVDIELTEKDTDGHTTHHYEQSTRITASGAKVTNEDETYTYDAKTGKKLTHDEKNSYGKVLHEEYDGTTGKQKSADETDNNRRAHRTYDSSTGTIKQEDIDNADKTHETIKYNSNGDKLSREKQYGNNGDEGTREWVYSPRTGKEVYTEWRAPNGKITKNNIDENGKYTPVED